MLAEKVKSTTFEQGKQVYVRKSRSVLSSGHFECDHEEANTRVGLQLLYRFSINGEF